jgi:serine phosphatase RsbU (regulator of sigma subunit)
VALAVGVAGSVLVGSVLEQAVRRRDAAMALYWSEHRVAETLQHRLLPSLPAVQGLDVAARYVAASDGQQVGGDWFDVFALGDAKTGVVIGDVMGHDIEAAAAMAQVRAGLRAYALEGGEPAPVVERLAHLVDAFNVTGLVTVIYGVLGPADDKGDRLFGWANAGHPPPLVCLPDRQVQELRDGSSSIIGAPGEGARAQGERLLPAGSLLVLYTDGLVERPGTALTDSIEQLRARLQQRGSATSADDVCDAILRAKPADQTRDDIAIVVLRLTAPAGKAGPVPPPGTPPYAQALHNPSMSRR